MNKRLFLSLMIVGLVIAEALILIESDWTSVEAQAKTTLTAGIGTPTLDGVASSGEWPSDSITTGRGLTMKAMVDATHLYVLATWEDSTNSVGKDHWTFDGASWSGSGDEDRVGIVWDMKDEDGNSLNGDDGAACATMCHSPIMRTNIGRVDVWHWKAQRFNPMGFSDDKYWDTCQECEDGGRHGDDGSGSGGRNRNAERTGPEYMAASDPGADVDFLADSQAVLDAFDPYGVEPGSVDTKVAFDDAAQFMNGAVIPGRVLTIPSGNRASVRSAGKWADGVWTVEFCRPRQGEVDPDGDPEDFAVVPGGSVDFTTETFDDMADHTQHPFANGAADTTVYTLIFPAQFVFPHVFNFDANNSSSIYVQNPSDSSSNDVTVTYVGQDGMTAGTEMKTLVANGSAEFTDLPDGFQGVAQVSCSGNCTATATWNFGLAGQANFAVGISPLDPTMASTSWAAPVPPVGASSGFGVGVYNPGSEATSCTVTYHAPGGEEAAMDSLVDIPAGGQIAQLSPNVPANIAPELIGPDGFLGSLVLECDDPVIPIVLNQDQVNGFPTPIGLDAQPD